MAVYLVTGGAGFIGSNIVLELVKRGQKVRVLDNLATGKRENLSSVKDKIEFIEGDITDAAVCKKACKGVDYVLHQAALPSVPRSIADPLTSNKANVEGTLQMLIAARDAKVKRFVYAGSSSAYGNQDVAVKTEELKPMPLSPYAVSKLTGEYYCKVFNDIYGLPTVVLRYFNVFGPHQDPHGAYAAVIPLFIKAMKEGKRPTIFGKGKHSRDFTFVANNVEANIRACTSPAAAVSGQIINIACGSSITLNELVAMINKALDTDIKPVYEAERPGDVEHSKADISKAAKLLGYKPLVGTEEGIKRTVAWMKTQ
jgi:nucleoside-diphosphate-sugar epimerase